MIVATSLGYTINGKMATGIGKIATGIEPMANVTVPACRLKQRPPLREFPARSWEQFQFFKNRLDVYWARSGSARQAK